ncbi:MAG TPA: hypothetical protein VKV27_04270 [Solirubrobacteraceae bacterium]|nr:hypothetical protein [Solirubrobacteraceae bacterium]
MSEGGAQRVGGDERVSGAVNGGERESGAVSGGGAQRVRGGVAVGALLRAPVHIRGAGRPFGELTVEDVRLRAEELHAAVGFGPTARVAPVARAWRELAVAMATQGALTVADLPPERLAELAPALWVLPPGGSLLG